MAEGSNTYQLEPKEDQRFYHTRVKAIIETTLEEKLKGTSYDSSKAADVTEDITKQLRSRVKQLKIPRYKIGVQGKDQEQLLNAYGTQISIIGLHILSPTRTSIVLGLYSECIWNEDYFDISIIDRYSSEIIYNLINLNNLFKLSLLIFGIDIKKELDFEYCANYLLNKYALILFIKLSHFYNIQRPIFQTYFQRLFPLMYPSKGLPSYEAKDSNDQVLEKNIYIKDQDQLEQLADLINTEFNLCFKNLQSQQDFTLVNMLQMILAAKDQKIQNIYKDLMDKLKQELKQNYHNIGAHSLDQDERFKAALSRFISDRNQVITKNVLLMKKYDTLLEYYKQKIQKINQLQLQLDLSKKQKEQHERVIVKNNMKIQKLTDQRNQFQNKFKTAKDLLSNDRQQFKNVKILLGNLSSHIEESSRQYKNQIDNVKKTVIQVLKNVTEVKKKKYEQDTKQVEFQNKRLHEYVDLLVFDLSQYVSFKKTDYLSCQQWVQKYKNIRIDKRPYKPSYPKKQPTKHEQRQNKYKIVQSAHTQLSGTDIDLDEQFKRLNDKFRRIRNYE